MNRDFQIILGKVRYQQVASYTLGYIFIINEDFISNELHVLFHLSSFDWFS